jgi:hypothetical protein
LASRKRIASLLHEPFPSSWSPAIIPEREKRRVSSLSGLRIGDKYRQLSPLRCKRGIDLLAKGGEQRRSWKCNRVPQPPISNRPTAPPREERDVTKGACTSRRRKTRVNGTSGPAPYPLAPDLRLQNRRSSPENRVWKIFLYLPKRIRPRLTWALPIDRRGLPLYRAFQKPMPRR